MTKVPVGENVKVLVITQHLVEQENTIREENEKHKGVPMRFPDLPYNGPKPTPEELANVLKELDKSGKLRVEGKDHHSVIRIPLRYQSDKTTPLLHNISAGPQEINITLEKE